MFLKLPRFLRPTPSVLRHTETPLSCPLSRHTCRNSTTPQNVNYTVAKKLSSKTMPDPKRLIDLNGDVAVSKNAGASEAVDTKEYEVIEEGSAKILFKQGEVFYNEVQVKNRDLSVLVLNAYAEQLEHEAKIQVEKRKKNQSWRKLPPTWNSWGRDYLNEELQAEKKKSGSEPKEKQGQASEPKDPKTGDQTKSTGTTTNDQPDKKNTGENAFDVDENNLALEGMFILEALGASGLRSLRYFNEVTSGVGVDKIVCNDLEDHAVEMIKRNIQYNASFLPSEEEKQRLKEVVQPSLGDATSVMINHRLANSQKTQHTRVLQYINRMSVVTETKICEGSSGAQEKLNGSESRPPPESPSQKKVLRQRVLSNGSHLKVFEGDYKRNYDGDAFDVVDLDPYGSCSVFLDSAVQAVRDGGLLCITSTDLATICGKNLEVCFAKYGSMALKAKYAHEFAIRVILGATEQRANCYGRYIVPLLSIQTDFYLRCFVRVYSSKAEIKKSALKLGMIAQSTGCDSFYIQPLGREIKEVHKPPPISVPVLCPETGQVMKLGGPIWIYPIHNVGFVKYLIAMFKRRKTPPESRPSRAKFDRNTTANQAPKNPYLSHWNRNDYTAEATSRSQASTHSSGSHHSTKVFDANELPSSPILKGVLYAVSEELQDMDSVLFYHLPSMCKLLKCSVPTLVKFQSAIMNAGYGVSQVHCTPVGVKTNAPPHVLWDILRAWVRETNPKMVSSIEAAASKSTSEEPAAPMDTEASACGTAHPDKQERTAIKDKVLLNPSQTDVNFAPHPEIVRRFKHRKNQLHLQPSRGGDKPAKEHQRYAERVTRWAKNPKPNWGPKTRAKGNSKLQTHKRKRNRSDSRPGKRRG